MRSTLPLIAAAASVLASASNSLAGGPGEVLWRFEIPSNYAGAHIGVGPDGVVYATDNLRLYAISPAGELLWTHDGAGGGRPITFGADGTIYTSAQSTGIRAVHPYGALAWEYMPPTDRVLHTGPNVGPDGNIYAVQEIRVGDGLGAFSVDATGALRWSNAGDPEIRAADLSNSDVVFGDGRFFAGMDYPRGAGAVTYSFALDGQQLWQSGNGDREIPATSFPRMMPDARLAFRYGQVGLMAVTQDGDIDWQLTHPDGVGYLIEPTVGPDGVIYAGAWTGVRLWAVNPDGTTRWAGAYQSGLTLDTIGVAPDNAAIVATGTPGWVRGYSPADGTLRWQVDLPPEQGLAQFASTVRPAFSPDSAAAYVTTRFVGDGVGHSYLYAISLTDAQACPADFNTDGQVNTLDVLAFLNAWSVGDMSADFNADGQINTLDVLAFLNAWSAGC